MRSWSALKIVGHDEERKLCNFRDSGVILNIISLYYAASTEIVQFVERRRECISLAVNEPVSRLPEHGL